MPVKIVGTKSKIKRVMTGLYSLDRAFQNSEGSIGFPVGIGCEIFGLTGTGKSTFTYSLAAILAREVGGNIALCDMEGFDSEFLVKVMESNGYSGTLYALSEENDEKQLDNLIIKMQKDCSVGILDSVGAIAPVGETEGEIGEANMGRRAFLMAQFSRKGLKLFRFSEDKTILMTNHWYPKLGSRGYDTPGGEAKKYLASIRIKLQRKETFPEKSYALIGTVAKNRWGYQDLTFNVFMLAGHGIHPGMSALWDCVCLKIVKRGKAGIMYGKENLGKIGNLAKLAKKGETEPFKPFFELLENTNESNTEDTSEEGDTAEGDGSIVVEEDNAISD